MAKWLTDREYVVGFERVKDCPYRQRSKHEGCGHTIYMRYRHEKQKTYFKEIYKCNLAGQLKIAKIVVKAIDRPYLRGLQQTHDWAMVQ